MYIHRKTRLYYYYLWAKIIFFTSLLMLLICSFPIIKTFWWCFVKSNFSGLFGGITPLYTPFSSPHHIGTIGGDSAPLTLHDGPNLSENIAWIYSVAGIKWWFYNNIYNNIRFCDVATYSRTLTPVIFFPNVRLLYQNLNLYLRF